MTSLFGAAQPAKTTTATTASGITGFQSVTTANTSTPSTLSFSQPLAQPAASATQPAVSQNATQNVNATTTSGGLGGFDSSAFSAAAASLVKQPNLGGLGQGQKNVPGSSAPVQNPKDTDVPPEFLQLFNELSNAVQKVSTNSDQCAAEGDFVEKTAQLGDELNADAARLAGFDWNMHRLEQRLAELKTRARDNCRTAESEKRRTVAGPDSVGGRRLYEPLGLLHAIVDEHEQSVMRHRDTLDKLERHVSAAWGDQTQAGLRKTDERKSLIDQLQQLEEHLRVVAEQSYLVHQMIEEEHDRLMAPQNQDILGGTASDPWLAKILSMDKRVTDKTSTHVGPDPFHNSSLAALMNVADHLAKTHTGSVAGAPVRMGQAFGGFGQMPQQSTSLFGAANTGAAQGTGGLFGTSMPVATSKPAFTFMPTSSAFGSGASTFRPNTSTGFFQGSGTGVLQSSQSGTLFPGVAAVRPFS